MSEPFLCEIRIVSFNFAPQGWALCNGQLMPIMQNVAVYALLGTTYGGNGTTDFALPDLRGRAPLHMNRNFPLGEAGGEVVHTLSVPETPAHSHTAQASASAGTALTPVGNSWAANPANPYSSAAPNAALNSTAIAQAGGGQPHENTQPYLALNFIIALQGIFPSQT